MERCVVGDVGDENLDVTGARVGEGLELSSFSKASGCGVDGCGWVLSGLEKELGSAVFESVGRSEK